MLNKAHSCFALYIGFSNSTGLNTSTDHACTRVEGIKLLRTVFGTGWGILQRWDKRKYMYLKIDLIATNHRVVAAKRQQRELVAVTIRGSVLFYSSAIWTSDFRSVKREFRYLYGVDLDRSKTLFFHWKMYIDHYWQWKNTKNKLESRRYRFCWYSSYILTTLLGLFTNRKTP